MGGSTAPNRVPEALRPKGGTKPSATTDEDKSNWRSTATATAKLFLRTVKDTSDAFPPLKSVAGSLCAILDNAEVCFASHSLNPRCSSLSQRTAANAEAIESLAPRVEALAESLCTPVSEGDTKEESRRRILER